MRRPGPIPLMIALAAAGALTTTGFTTGAPTPAKVAATVTASAAGNDPVDGVGMIYPTRAGGQVWHLSNNPGGDPRLDGATMTPNPDGTFSVRDTAARIGVSTTTYDQDEDEDGLTWRQPDLRSRGFMHDANDWRNVEITGYVRYVSGTDDSDAFTWYARGARHTGSGQTPQTCWGTAYKGDLRYADGAVKIEKELYHLGGDGYAKGTYTGGGASIKGKMVGFKVVMYDIPGGVRVEAYLDRAGNNTWTRVTSRDDTGTWAIETDNRCGGTRTEKVTWGGPKAAFRWDDATKVDLTKFSVREIAPGGPANPCPAKLTAAGATASTWEEINPPANAIDGNLATRWSGQGYGANLVLDLGTSRPVCGVDVAWYLGNTRWNDYTVYTSPDNVTYTKVAEGRSSGTTLNAEPYRFPRRQARFVRISWWNSSAGNGWASIAEATVVGAS
ncbi:discoidin domain-containing protein [Streptosporangium sp. NPDC001681]|uniref:discoidin domain-containing protein n=1 Tax=Streptosporangium sp. NPDC001681 TaxID=3154395 RepID=UPI00331686BA